MLRSRPCDSPTHSQDETYCGQDAGDVLIRSTRVPPQNQGRKAGPELARSVQITVQKLRDPEHVQPHCNEKERRQEKPMRASADSRAGPELLTSRFTAGGRGVVLGALKQRSHSTHHRREVRVQLLQPRPPQNTTSLQERAAQSSQDAAVVAAAAQTEARPSSGCLGDSRSAAAAAAAAVAATAPILKAQSDIEARMSQLADGVQKLLHTNRTGESRERSMSQQTLQHLETLQSQQLQLQSQLLESALKIVTGHASVTPHVSASANGVRKQQTSSSATGSPAAGTTAMETVPVTVETCSCEHGQKRNRDSRYLQNKSMTEASYPQSVACHSQEAVRRANEMLKKMGRLNTDMKMLLTPEDSPQFTRIAPDPHQDQQHQPQLQQQKSQQDHFQTHQKSTQQSYPLQCQSPKNNSQNNHFSFQPFQDQHRETHMNRSQHLKANQNQSQSQNPQSSQTKPQQNSYPHSLFHQIPSQENHIPETQSQRSQSALVHKRSVGPSMLEEAGQVLRQAQRQKKVLDENLEALLKAKNGEILHCQLEALAANRDWTEEVQIKKTVDTWINTLSSDFQTPPSPPQAGKSSVDAARCRSADTGTSQQRAAGRGRPLSVLRATGAKPVMERGSRGKRAGLKTEAESDRVTGKLTSSQQVEVDRQSHLSRMYGKVPYEGLRRTLKKSPYLHFSSPASPLSRKPCPRLVESIRGVRLKSCKTQTSLTPPLSLSPGHPQHHHVFSSSHRTSHDPGHHTMTFTDSSPVAMAIPLGRPRMDSSSKCERTQEVASGLTAPLPTTVVTMDTKAPEEQSRLDANNEAPSSPILVILENDCEKDKEGEEESLYPGTDSLNVTDIVQEEENELGNGALVLHGHPSSTPVLYHGPAFPPEALSSHPAQNKTPVPSISPQQDVLENRLVEWLSQQLLSRMIADIYRPPISDPAQNDQSGHSELEEQSLTSDIVEAAGGGGLQLFVDSNVPVDSDLIRKLVNEALAETVAQVLGQKDALDPGEEARLERADPEPRAHEEEELVSLVATPVPTPLPSVAQPSRETPPVTTPPPSEPSSPLDKELPPPTTAAEPVTTPTTTPEPHVSEGSSSAVDLSLPPPELTDEERPEEHVDSHNKQLVVFVAEEEPTPCSPFRAPPLSPAASLSALAERTPVPPSTSTEDSSSSCSSTVTAETEAALKHISEGELLISASQWAPLTEEEAFGSVSSSLQELQDMDLDPPTVEQVKGHNLLLTLLTKMDQGVTHKGKRLQPDGSWERETEEEMSVGEVRDCEAANPALQNQTSSDGQNSQAAAGQQEKEPGGRRKMKDLTASIRPQEEEEEEEEVMEMEEPLSAAAADTDSSTNDVF
ncbi:protein TALPID3 isoform X2 [Leuresthes tenuis]|uniref:protein TALPID3 isoform X2 n=1 Tax=Leuresthes tenuis TaxID=355514 RepID=UPI003B510F50